MVFDPLSSQLSHLHREGEEREAQRRAAELQLSYINLSGTPINPEALKYISLAESQEAGTLPLEEKHTTLALGVLDPRQGATQALLERLRQTGLALELFIISPSSLAYGQGFYRFVSAPQEKITSELTVSSSLFQTLRKDIISFEALQKSFHSFDFQNQEISEFLSLVFANAVILRASDIHFEPEESLITLRFRIDGVLHPAATLSPSTYVEILSHIKLLSQMKLNVTREAQDGRFTLILPDVSFEVRSSVIPSGFGETMVLRLLDPHSLFISFEELGLREDDVSTLREELKRPNGMILVTGPTGSGKTTTLYAFLASIKSPELKMLTLENPIEYHLEGVQQTQVDSTEGYSFAEGLKAILRQDPDVILIGEIRDLQTADTALNASLTGHLVFSTLHTNDAAGALPRLIDLGVQPSLLAPALNLIVAQRLVRRLCENCKTPVSLTDAVRDQARDFIKALPKNVLRETFSTPVFYEARGCSACGELGYRGRIGLFEFLKLTPHFDKLLHSEGFSEPDILEAAREQGFVTMQEDGILKALHGQTSLSEVERATGPIDWKRSLKTKKA